MNDKTMKKVSQKLTPTKQQLFLLQLVLRGENDREDIGLLFENLDIDNTPSDYLLLLAVYGKRRNWNGFPPDVIPRLTGIRRFYQVKNTTLIPDMLSLLDEYQKEKIPVMLVKGISMRAFYCKDLPRIMSDADVIVKQADYRRALKTARAHGFAGDETDHSTDLRKGLTVVDVHEVLFKNHTGNDEHLWNAAVPIEYFGRKVYVPSPEYAYVLHLYNKWGNTCTGQSDALTSKWLVDAWFIMKYRKLDLHEVFTIAKRCGITSMILGLTQVISQCFPELITEQEVGRIVKEELGGEAYYRSRAYRDWVKAWRKLDEYHDSYVYFEKNRDHCTLLPYIGMVLKKHYGIYRISKITNHDNWCFLQYFLKLWKLKKDKAKVRYSHCMSVSRARRGK